MRPHTRRPWRATSLAGPLSCSLLCALLFALLFIGGCSATSAPRQELEKQFTETMTGAVLEGSFTVDGRESAAPRKEKYTIESVQKLAGGIWTINARIQYGGHDVTVPVPVRIEWAGDTPVISLTDVEVPGLGTFTARVLFYRGRYAGTWQHGETGGSQFGRILPAHKDNP